MTSTTGRPKFKRRIYIVDRRMQLSIIGTTLGVLFLLAAFFVAAIHLVLDNRFFELMSGDEVRTLLLRLSFTYFLFCVSSVFALTVIMTHRCAGPARVIRTALEGILEGDFDRRLSLREKDYFKDLAETTSDVRDMVVQGIARRRVIYRELDEAVSGADMARAQELIAELSTIDGHPTVAPTPEEVAV